MRSFHLALFFASVVFFGSTTQAGVIARWDFESENLNPSTGLGTASYVGGTNASGSGFAQGTGGSGTFGWNTTSYPAQQTNAGTAGVQFMVSTLGYQDISLSFDHRASNTASRWAQFDYTIDGANWVTGFWDNSGGLSPAESFYSFSVDFSSVSGANNNPDFGVRIVSIFSPLAFNQNANLSYEANQAYMRANAEAKYDDPGIGTQNYGTGGTWRFDNVTFLGNEHAVIPEPSVLALVSFVLALSLVGSKLGSKLGPGLDI